MTVYGIVGLVDDTRTTTGQRPPSAGNGKTCLMTHILNQEFLRKDRLVIANYHLRFKGGSFAGPSWARYMPTQEIFDNWFNDDLEGAIIAITELQSIFNSAGRSAKVITYLEKCLNQRRKSDYDLIWDSQRWGSVDKRIRDVTDELFYPVKWHTEYNPDIGIWIPTHPCSIDNCQERHQIAVHREFPAEYLDDRIIPLYFINTWEIGELYNTKEKMRDVLKWSPKWEEAPV
jgi:hypothetical protein